jgi:hypothetical protein
MLGMCPSLGVRMSLMVACGRNQKSNKSNTYEVFAIHRQIREYRGGWPIRFEEETSVLTSRA